jgi:type II secretory ATPase GspE/PulE/Tfp pilus assembly ATPase PilB-like protein
MTTESDSSVGEILNKLLCESDDISPPEMNEDTMSGEVTISESDNTIIQVVNKIIYDAIRMGATAIHIEPNITKKMMAIRYRVDDECILSQTLPYRFATAIVSRIKIMSNLDIAERRLPQDGRIKVRHVRHPGDEENIWVGIVPTHGRVEDVVMKIKAAGQVLPLDCLGLSQESYDSLIHICERPYGMALVAGPAGSGKTTMLHSMVHCINTPNRKIWTAEDPIDVIQDGLRQVQVQENIGFGVDAAIRTFLRCDPDAIMLSSLDNLDAFRMALHAAKNDCFVLGAINTEHDTPLTVERIIESGIDRASIAESILGILSQRLVRKLCENCREPYTPAVQEYDDLAAAYGKDKFSRLGLIYSTNLTLYRAKGCHSCYNAGYKGRVGIHELLVGTDSIKKMIQRQAGIEELRSALMEEGMTTLFQDGICKVLRGITDMRQVRMVLTYV